MCEVCDPVALLPGLPLSAAAFDIFNIEGFIFALLDLSDCGLELIIFALALLQEIEGYADNLSWLFENPRSDLRVNELLLLRSEFDHGSFPRRNRRL